jgi:hypothetical protein
VAIPSPLPVHREFAQSAMKHAISEMLPVIRPNVVDPGISTPGFNDFLLFKKIFVDRIKHHGRVV